MENVDLPQLWNIFNQVCFIYQRRATSKHVKCTNNKHLKPVFTDAKVLSSWMKTNVRHVFVSPPSADHHFGAPASPSLLSASAVETSRLPRSVRPLRTQRHGVGELQACSRYKKQSLILQKKNRSMFLIPKDFSKDVIISIFIILLQFGKNKTWIKYDSILLNNDWTLNVTIWKKGP